MKTLSCLFLIVMLFNGVSAASATTASEAEIDRRLSRVEKSLGQLADDREVDRLSRRVSTLEQKVGKVANQSLVLILFGAFCALWAQNTGRNSWLWFFLGLFFSFITVLVLLWKNSDDLDRRRRASPA